MTIKQLMAGSGAMLVGIVTACGSDGPRLDRKDLRSPDDPWDVDGRRGVLVDSTMRRDRFAPRAAALDGGGANGPRWAKLDVSVSIMPDGTLTASGMPSELFAQLGGLAPTREWQREFARALQAWVAVTPLNFRFVPDSGGTYGAMGSRQSDPRFGDIRLGGAPRNDAFVGYVNFPDEGSGTSGGDTLLNTRASFQIGAGLDLFSSLLHEVGHAIGLYHSHATASVMSPSIRSVYLGLSRDDVAGAQAIYGARTPDAFDRAATNDSLGEASEVAGPGPFSGDITTADDVDCYRLTIPADSAGNLHLDVAPMSLLNPMVEIYDATQTLIGSVAAPGYGRAATFDAVVVPGADYFVKIAAGDPIFAVGAYRLSLDHGGLRDVAPPVIEVSVAKFGDGEDLTVVIDGTITDDGAMKHYQVLIDETTVASGTSGRVSISLHHEASVANLAPGPHAVLVRALDGAENGSEKSYSFSK